MTRPFPGPGRAARRRRGDRGHTVVEMMTVLIVVSFLMIAFSTAVRLMTTATTRTRSGSDATTQSRNATDALSRSIPFASQANLPTLVGTRWYVELLTTAVQAGGSATCTQWLLDTTNDVLQTRSWPQGSTTATGWTTVARYATNDPVTAVPFAVYAADSTFTLPRISVFLTFTGPNGGTATGRGVYTLRNAANAGAVGTNVVCTEVGRP